MKRIIMMVLRNLPFIPMAWFKLCWYASHVDNYTEGEPVSYTHLTLPTN